VEVFNVLGETVYSTKITSDNTEINLKNQPNGVYLFKVMKEDGSAIGKGKLIIQK
jgi:hypothetical protein